MGIADINGLTTEKRNPDTIHLDEMSSLEIVKEMNREDQLIPEAIRPNLPKIARIIDTAASCFQKGGRLIYMGAGTSGRLGVMDASECPPTFGVPATMVIGLIAGGETAFTKAVEGAEDSEDLAYQDLKKISLSSLDLLVGLSASGRTPYVLGGLKYARQIGAATASISCNSPSAAREWSDIPIEVNVGAEILSGSTRLKSGTAEKMILNMISTGAMVRIGKVYENLMIDVQQTNEKLQSRGERIVMEATGVSEQQAKTILARSEGSCKVAITSILAGISPQEARDRLAENGGFVRPIINSQKK